MIECTLTFINGLLLRTTGLVAVVVSLWGISPAGAADVLAIQDVRVFDGNQLLPSATVVVRDGLIEAVGSDVAIPEGASVVDGAGQTLLPGLIDAHTHTFSTEQLRQAVVFGVTTELDMLTMHQFAAAMRSEQRNGKANDRADLFSAGSAATAPGGHGTQYGLTIPTITNAAQADAFVEARVAEGSDYLKIIWESGEVIDQAIPTIDRETLEALVEAAHQQDILAVVHIHTLEKARGAIEAGVDGLVHTFMNEPIDDALVELALDRGVFVVPTLDVTRSIAANPGREALINDAGLNPYLSDADRQSLATGFPGNYERPSYDVARGSVKAFHKAGVPILAGTDAPNPGTAHGVSIHRELELLVEAGLTPLDALASATSKTADAFGLSDRGRIAPGKRADLVLVAGDPATEITATRAIEAVWKGGQPIDRAAYQQQVAQQSSNMAKSPAGLEEGVISDFEDGSTRTAFGAGWSISTDSLFGGSSTATIQVVPEGADESSGALLVEGDVSKPEQPRFAGVMFSPGAIPMSPADLSAMNALSFRAKGEGGPFAVMLFSSDRGLQPSMELFETKDEWTEHRIAFEEFDGSDGSGVMGFFFGTDQAGTFSLWLDDVRLESDNAAPSAPEAMP